MYFKDKDHAGSGLFGAPYLKYSRQAFTDIPFDTSIDSTGIDIPVTDITSNKFALGFALGSKTVYDSGLMYGWFVGIGRNLLASRSFSNSDVTDAQKESLSNGTVGW